MVRLFIRKRSTVLKTLCAFFIRYLEKASIIKLNLKYNFNFSQQESQGRFSEGKDSIDKFERHAYLSYYKSAITVTKFYCFHKVLGGKTVDVVTMPIPVRSKNAKKTANIKPIIRQ